MDLIYKRSIDLLEEPVLSLQVHFCRERELLALFCCEVVGVYVLIELS